MTHERCEHLLHISRAEALSETDQQALDAHLSSCAACSRLRDDLDALGTLLGDHRSSTPVDDRLLDEARRDLHRALRSEPVRPTLRRRGARALWWLFGTGPRIAWSAAGLVVCGLAAGAAAGPLLLPVRTTTDIPAGTRMSNFRLAPASADGQVDCRYDLITPVQVSGKLDDPRIQRALAGAIVGEENPGVRLRAVNAVAGRRLAGADREIRAALILALTSDPNPGVRMEALRALRRLPLADDIKSALLTTLLTDTNSGLRIAAINGLDSSFTAPLQIDPDVLSALRVTAARDDNNYIRQKSRTVLEEVRNP
jgi:hypothetical protein